MIVTEYMENGSLDAYLQVRDIDELQLTSPSALLSGQRREQITGCTAVNPDVARDRVGNEIFIRNEIRSSSKSHLLQLMNDFFPCLSRISLQGIFS